MIEEKTVSHSSGKPEPRPEMVLGPYEVLQKIAGLNLSPDEENSREETLDMLSSWAKDACPDKNGMPNVLIVTRKGKNFGVLGDDAEKEMLQHFAVLQRTDFYIPYDCAETNALKAFELRITSEEKIFRGNDKRWHLIKTNGQVVGVKHMVVYKVKAYSCNFGGKPYTKEWQSDSFNEALGHYIDLKKNAKNNWRIF